MSHSFAKQKHLAGAKLLLAMRNKERTADAVAILKAARHEAIALQAFDIAAALRDFELTIKESE